MERDYRIYIYILWVKRFTATCCWSCCKVRCVFLYLGTKLKASCWTTCWRRDINVQNCTAGSCCHLTRPLKLILLVGTRCINWQTTCWNRTTLFRLNVGNQPVHLYNPKVLTKGVFCWDSVHPYSSELSVVDFHVALISDCWSWCQSHRIDCLFRHHRCPCCRLPVGDNRWFPWHTQSRW